MDFAIGVLALGTTSKYFQWTSLVMISFVEELHKLGPQVGGLKLPAKNEGAEHACPGKGKGGNNEFEFAVSNLQRYQP